MRNKVEIVNNAYNQNIRILINGKAVSVYGTLEQYQDEPFWNWCDVIFEEIYRECNQTEYTLYYMGREEEDLILCELAKKIPYCQYVSVRFENNIPFQERMKQLNGVLIKSGKHINKEIIPIKFLLSTRYAKYQEMLSELSVENSYCAVKPYIEEMEYISSNFNEIIYVIANEIDLKQLAEKYKNKFVFAIKISDKTLFLEKEKRVFAYSCTEKELFQTIFECLKFAPLLTAFLNCLNALKNADINTQIATQLATIQSIENEIQVEIDSTEIELGKSVSINMNKNGNRIKEHVTFEYSVPDIVTCNGMRIEGKKEGAVKLYIFREGENIPFCVKELFVRKRNRIQKINLEDYEICLGSGDEFVLNYDIYPLDADNRNMIRFKTSDTKIISVDSHGRIKALAPGKCQIYVIAEQISNVADCIVRAYMNEIKISTEYVEMFLGDTYYLEVECFPKDCIDGEIFIESQDLQIANIVDHTIKAVGYGETQIVISNQRNTIKRNLLISVKQKPKKGFFARLFHRENK